MKLSILICSLFNRQSSLERLLGLLEEQMTSQVEILVEKDNGEMTIGDKRNKLLKKAQGLYICFIDDDDLVSKDYIPKILEAIKTEPDCCGIEGRISWKRKGIDKLFIHSLKYETWFEKDGVYYRCPNHLNPVKREIALQVMFAPLSSGEDMKYSLDILPLLKEEVYIEEPIYFYLAGT